MGPNQPPRRYDDSNWRLSSSGSRAWIATSAFDSTMRPVATSTGSFSRTFSPGRRPTSSAPSSTAFRAVLRSPCEAAPSAPSFSASRSPPRASPAPLVPISSGMRRPTNSEGSFLKPSTAAWTIRSGWEAVETRPDSVMLTFCTYAAGWVRL